MRKFLTLDDVPVAAKRVFLRVDINSPLDPASQQILDDSRIRAITDTIESLAGAKIVLGSHQSRPGKDDFTSLASHAAVLQRYCNCEVAFVDDVLGKSAREAIVKVKKGQVLVLENLRFWAEENADVPLEKQTKTIFVRTLAPMFDLYVNDAFAAAHRSHPSLVGLPRVLPACAGRLMVKELDAVRHVLEKPKHPAVFVLGGAKLEDKVPVVERILASDRADKVLVGGIVAKLFLKAQGHDLSKNEFDEIPNVTNWVRRATRILRKFPGQVVLPDDVAVESRGERREVPVVDHLGQRPFWDIGAASINKYSRILEEAGTVVAVGPLGVFERNGFDTGTRKVLVKIAGLSAFTLIGGGHLCGLAGILGIEERFSHLSTAGGAVLSLLAGDVLPAVQALEAAFERRPC